MWRTRKYEELPDRSAGQAPTCRRHLGSAGLVLLSCLSVLAGGCVHPGSPDRETPRRSQLAAQPESLEVAEAVAPDREALRPSQVGAPPESLEVAEAVAIEEVLKRATRLDWLKREVGVIYFKNISQATLDVLGARIGKKLPSLETNMEHFDDYKWVDKRTGKLAMVVWAKLVSSAAGVATFDVEEGRSPVAGGGYLVEMKLVGKEWVVAKFRQGGVS